MARTQTRCVFSFVAMALVALGAAATGVQARYGWSGEDPARVRELLVFRGESGYSTDGTWLPMFSKPYARATAEKVLRNALNTEYSVRVREGWIHYLNDMVRFQEVPPADLEDKFLPAAEKLSTEKIESSPAEEASRRDRGERWRFLNVPPEDLEDKFGFPPVYLEGKSLPAAEKLSREKIESSPDQEQSWRGRAGRLLWNIKYASALAASAPAGKSEAGKADQATAEAARREARTTLEQLRREATESLRTTKVDRLGDLIGWYVKASDLEALRGLLPLAGEWGGRRVNTAIQVVTLARQLADVEQEAKKSLMLLKVAKDDDAPAAVRGWAIRQLVTHPSDEARGYLMELFDKAPKLVKKEMDALGLGYEAQEALKKLGVIPKNEYRYASM